MLGEKEQGHGLGFGDSLLALAQCSLSLGLALGLSGSDKTMPKLNMFFLPLLQWDRGVSQQQDTQALLEKLQLRRCFP